MTDRTDGGFPFGDGPLQTGDDADEARNRKALLMVAGVAGALVLAAGAWFLLGGDSEETTTVAAPPTRSPVAASPSPTAAAAVPARYQGQLGRDPFRALYVQPAASPAVPAAAAVPASTAAPVQPAATEHKLVLQRVYGSGSDQTAAFTIDGRSSEARIGSTFGPTAEIVLRSLRQGPKAGQWTATLQVGDSSPFEVVTGVPAYVR
jgi:hypothetical protein